MLPTKLIETLQTCQHLTVLTGAGVSAESGIPTFRDALTGYWSHYDPASLASEIGFLADPALVWGWYEWRRQRVLKALPNPAHVTLAQLATQLPKLTLITQNVDDLHERAGNQNVIHLHGSLHHPRCIACEVPYTLPEQEKIGDDQPLTEQRLEPPRCPCCNGTIRPGVVWFGESLPVEAWEKAVQTCRSSDLLLIIGTSGMVYPAAQLPFITHAAGICIAQINPEINEFNSVVDFNLSGKAGIILPQLYAAAFGNTSNISSSSPV